MTLTQAPQANLAVAIDEHAISVLIAQLRAQHPELFYYATQWVRDSPGTRLHPAPPVALTAAQITSIPPLSLPGSHGLALDLSVQVTGCSADFFPAADAAVLDGQMALTLTVAVAIGQPTAAQVAAAVAAPSTTQRVLDPATDSGLLVANLTCTAILGAGTDSTGDISAQLVSLAISDLAPADLAALLDGVLTTEFEAVLLPKLTVNLDTLLLSALKDLPITIALVSPPSVPKNPIIKNNQLVVLANAT